jgi:hypothetical protein
VVGNDSYEDCVDCCGACNPDGGGTLDGCLLECSQLPSDCTPESEGFNACCACLDCCEEQNGDVPGAAGQCKNGCADLLPGDGRFISCAGLCEAHCAATSTSCADCRSCCSATDPADRPGQSSCDTMCQNQFPGPGCASIGPPTADQEACAALAAAIAKCIPIPFANGLSCDPPSGNAGGADWVACRLACFTAQQCLSKRLRGHTVPPACRGMLTGYGGAWPAFCAYFFVDPPQL